MSTRAFGTPYNKGFPTFESPTALFTAVLNNIKRSRDLVGFTKKKKREKKKNLCKIRHEPTAKKSLPDIVVSTITINLMVLRKFKRLRCPH